MLKLRRLSLTSQIPSAATDEARGGKMAADEARGQKMALYLVHQSESGYALFHARGIDEIGQSVGAVVSSVLDLEWLSEAVKLVGFAPFSSAVDALNQRKAISEGIMTVELSNFLELNLPKVKEGKKSKFSVGVGDHKVGSHITKATGIPSHSNECIEQLLSAVRLHFGFLDQLKPSDLEKAQLGLGQAIFLLDTIDMVVNSDSMRMREWYGYGSHFPELIKIVNDNYLYAKLAKFIVNKSDLSEKDIPALACLIGDDDKSKQIVEAATKSMGQDLSSVDLITVQQFARKIMNLSECYKNLYEYLVTKMNDIAPNLRSLIGEMAGARLILHAGSLSNLANSPASVVQRLGAEMAPSSVEYSIISHSSFIGRASAKNKGRMLRFLSNKCVIASRIDCYSDLRTPNAGEKLRKQVEEKLDLYEKGVAPHEKGMTSKVLEDGDGKENVASSAKRTKTKKSRAEADGDAMDLEKAAAEAQRETEKKKKKKNRKRKSKNRDAAAGSETEKKKKGVAPHEKGNVLEDGDGKESIASSAKRIKKYRAEVDGDTMDLQKAAAEAERETEKKKKKNKKRKNRDAAAGSETEKKKKNKKRKNCDAAADVDPRLLLKMSSRKYSPRGRRKRRPKTEHFLCCLISII